VGLNPDAADNNVYLVADTRGGCLSGRWVYSTFVGPVSGGTFTATPVVR
jgi:hypothetical protein